MVLLVVLLLVHLLCVYLCVLALVCCFVCGCAISWFVYLAGFLRYCFVDRVAVCFLVNLGWGCLVYLFAFV